MLPSQKRLTESGTAFLGVSGFGYPSWRGEFDPASAKASAFLKLYAERLPSPRPIQARRKQGRVLCVDHRESRARVCALE